jgi:hypothetical protein
MNIRIDPRTAELSFWFVLCAGLAGLVGQQVDWGQQLHAPNIPINFEAAKFSAPAISLAFKIESSDRYLEIVERPLFIFTRRPAPPPLPPAPPSMMKKGQFKLSGVSIVGNHKLAFLVEIATKRTKVVREGEKINDMTLEKVEPGGVVLAQGSDQEQLWLAVALSSKSTQPTAVIPPAVTGTAGTLPKR